MDGEWTLVLFTVLSQMAVGTFLLLSALLLATRGEIDSAGRKALVAAGLVLAAALLASLFHLKSPLDAYKMMNNLGTSWLSREILFVALFLGTGCLYAVVEFKRIGSVKTRILVASVAAIMGIGLVYCMARVYMLRTVPAWNTWLTLATFFSTGLLLGAAPLVVAFRGDDALSKRLAAALVTLVVVRLVLAVATAQSAGGEVSRGLAETVAPPEWIAWLQGALLLLGGACFGAVLVKKKTPASLVQGAFLFLLVSELLGRFLFYEG